MIIVQPFIPAVTGKKAFGAAEQDAQRVGMDNLRIVY